MKKIAKNIYRILSVFFCGGFLDRTDAMQKLRDEMLNRNFGSFRTDKENLIQDRKKVSKDFRQAFEKYQAELKV